MNHRMLVSFAVGAVLASTGMATARPRPKQGKPFEANKTFGVGLMLGEPTGFTAKYFMDTSHALDFGIGGYDDYRNRAGLDIHVDYLWHPVSLVSTEDFELPLYFGIGGRILDFRHNPNDDHGVALGVRAPVGVAVDFNNIPLDVFLELALVLDFYVDYAVDDDVGLGIDGAIGVRYWFN